MEENLVADCLILLDDVQMHNLIADKMLGHYDLRMPRHYFNAAPDALQFLTQPPECLPQRILLLVDLMMPQMTGLQFADRLLNMPSWLQSRCRMFIVSSTLDERDLEAIDMHKAIEGFLPKPINPSELVTLLSQPVPEGKWAK